MKRITANQYQTSERYYKLPKILFEDEKYMDMKLEVKVLVLPIRPNRRVYTWNWSYLKIQYVYKWVVGSWSIW